MSPTVNQQRLRAQLADAADGAVDMLAGRVPPDASVLLAALEAAALLPDEVQAPVDRERVRRIEAQARGSDALSWLVRGELALEPEPWPDGEDPRERRQRVHRLVRLAALRTWLDEADAAPIDLVLEEASGAFLAHPERFADLAPTAASLVAELRAVEPVATLLEDLASTAELAQPVLSDAQLRESLRRAEAAATPARRWSEVLADWIDDAAEALDVLLTPPRIALAADEGGEPPPRVRLWTEGEQELTLFRDHAGLVLEWYGEAPPTEVLLGDLALPEAPARVEDSRCWRLPPLPPGGRPVFTLRWPDRSRVLGGPA